MKSRDFLKVSGGRAAGQAVCLAGLAQSSPENQVAPDVDLFRSRSIRSMEEPSR